MNIEIIHSILIILCFALITAVIFRRFKLPTVLGYIVVGVLIGPHSLSLLTNSYTISLLAEFGIVFLLFSIGLEFSIAKIQKMKFSIFILGFLQVVGCVLITMSIAIFLEMSVISSFIFGGVVAMSSTAIVLKGLSENGSLETQYAKRTIGILIFQDISIIPFIIVLATLASGEKIALGYLILFGLLKGILALALIFIICKWVVKPFIYIVAKTQLTELLTLVTLLLAISFAALTHALGLSYALGAFLAGVMLADTNYKHQIQAEIRPFKDVLIGLFFISIGMLVNPHFWISAWEWIFLLLTALILGKFIIIYLLNKLTKETTITSVKTGLLLAHGGEFSFLILTLAITNHLIPYDYGQVILSAILLSMIIAILFIQFNAEITNFLIPKLKQDVPSSRAISNENHHVILCGFGRFGQNIGTLLKQQNIGYLALEIDPAKVNQARLNGHTIQAH